MDEILATIRRIIAQDEATSGTVPAGGAALRGAAIDGSAATAGGGDDILELTAALNDDGSVRHLVPAGSSSEALATEREPPPVATSAEPDAVTSPAPEPSSGGAEPLQAQTGEVVDGHLVSETASLAAAAAFARLASAPRGAHAPHGTPLVGDRPLEDIVRELLRPLLQTWLDANLPRIVERLVEAEIARVAGKPGPA